MLEVSLRKSGFSVTTAIHATDARDKLKHATPDLIITDTKLPGDENGFDFVANLKSQPETASIPIIFLSSENRLEQKVTGLELGVEDYLTKPIYIKEVLTRVRVLLDKREKQTLERRERSSSFAGLLGDMGLVDLMQTVEIGRKTGRLFIETRSQKGQVSFREGKVTDARCGRLTGERAFYRMLVWNEGVFSMEFGAHDEADVIELSTQGLLMEGMRRVDEWGRLIEQLPPLDHVFEIDFGELVDRLAEIPDEINALLRQFDGRRTMLNVVDETDFGDLEALEIASKLYFEGLIFDVSDREPAEPAQPGKVEAWLQEPAGVHDDDGSDGGDQLLEPSSESLLPQPAALPRTSTAALTSLPPSPVPALVDPGGGFLAPPSGASTMPTMMPTTAPTPAPTSTATMAPPPPPATSQVPTQPGVPAALVPTLTLTPTSTPLPSPAPPPSPPVSPLPAALPKTSSSTLPTAGGAALKAAAAAAPLARAPTPRPLPVADDGEQESRSVAPRSAVGATAWSTKQPAHAADDEWEDVIAPDEHTPADGLAAVTPPPPPPLLATVSATLPPLSSSPPPPESLTLSSTSALSSSSSALSSLPQPSTDADALARDLGLSDDELALALGGSDEGAPPTLPATPAEAAATLIDAAAPLNADAERRLAESIAAQLDDDDDDTAARPASATDRSAADTDPGRRRPPAETPLTMAPSLAPLATLPAQAVPEAASSTALSQAQNDDDGIHDRRTKLDIDGDIVIDRGFRPSWAAAIFAVGFVGVAALVMGPCSGGGHDAADAGVAVVDVVPVVDAGAVAVVDAGAVVVDAGAVVVVDAGAVVPVVVDAGAVVPVVPDVVDAFVDAGVAPKKPPDVVADPGPTLSPFAKLLKAGDAAAKRGEHAKSVREYKAALALEKDSVAAHLGLGNAYYELDNLDAALVHLERARALAPKDAQTFVLLGAVYQSAGRKADAVTAYERYLELAPAGKFARDVKGILRGLKG